MVVNEINYLGLPLQNTAAQGAMTGWVDSTYIRPNYFQWQQPPYQWQWQYPWYPQYYPQYPTYAQPVTPIVINVQPDPRIEHLEKRVEELERKLNGKTKK